MIPVSEIFGPTIQGEGSFVGTKTYFIRTHGCDYRCEWCDTTYAREGYSYKELTVEEILQRLDVSLCRVVTLTGGNPCIYNLRALVMELRRKDFKIHVETQGSIWRPWLEDVHHITVSPKPPSSGNVTPITTLSAYESWRYVPSMELKVVVFDNADYNYAKEVHQYLPHIPLTLQAGSMVGNVDRIGWLIDKAMQDKDLRHNIRVLPQLHVLLWGSKRGV